MKLCWNYVLLFAVYLKLTFSGKLRNKIIKLASKYAKKLYTSLPRFPSTFSQKDKSQLAD